MFNIEYAEEVADDLAGLRAFDRKRLLDQIDGQLTHQPDQESKNRKIIVGIDPPWDHEIPIWQMRVGEYRVFYDVDQAGGRVVIRAIRHKPPHMTTEDIL